MLEADMCKYLAPLGAACVLYVTFVSCAIAKPVTGADLSGKSICWGDGAKDTYMPGGKYLSTRHGAGTWEISSIGVEIHSQTWTGVKDIEKLPDGTFTFAIPGLFFPGKYCK